MSFEEDLAAEPDLEFKDVDLLLKGHLYTFRFTRMDALLWASECDKYPPRPGIAFDRRFGYNIRALTIGAAILSGARMEDGNPVEMSEAQWRDLFTRIDGAAFKQITDDIWEINELGPAEAVDAAKKAQADSENNSASRSSSGSRRNVSSAGNQKK